jgi:hypothetical protein
MSPFKLPSHEAEFNRMAEWIAPTGSVREMDYAIHMSKGALAARMVEPPQGAGWTSWIDLKAIARSQ